MKSETYQDDYGQRNDCSKNEWRAGAALRLIGFVANYAWRAELTIDPTQKHDYARANQHGEKCPDGMEANFDRHEVDRHN